MDLGMAAGTEREHEVHDRLARNPNRSEPSPCFVRGLLSIPLDLFAAHGTSICIVVLLCP